MKGVVSPEIKRVLNQAGATQCDNLANNNCLNKKAKIVIIPVYLLSDSWLECAITVALEKSLNLGNNQNVIIEKENPFLTPINISNYFVKYDSLNRIESFQTKSGKEIIRFNRSLDSLTAIIIFTFLNTGINGEVDFFATISDKKTSIKTINCIKDNIINVRVVITYKREQTGHSLVTVVPSLGIESKIQFDLSGYYLEFQEYI